MVRSAPPPVALTVAGSDPSGGAGVQADLKTFHAFGCYGAAVLTAVTVQDTTTVSDVHDLPRDLIAAQLATVLADLPVAAMKTGMLGTSAGVVAVAAVVRARPVPALVVDPVLVASTGRPLAAPGVAPTLRAELLPLATLVTPNLSEAAALTGRPVHDLATMRDAARALVDLGVRAALITGGHLPGPPHDVLLADGTWHAFEGPRVGAGESHGTGCTLSAAVTACLASGLPLLEAVGRARRYTVRALASAPALGRGRRPLDHLVDPDPL